MGLLERFRNVLPLSPPAPGLHTHRLSLPGGERRVHLRVEEEGYGVLFVDVTEVIHLNPTATELAAWALDGVPRERARTALWRRYRGVARAQLAEETERIYALVAGLGSGEGCPTCALAGELSFRPVFSTPVSAPFKADVALTYACNNACPHCYNEPDRFAMPTLSTEGWFDVIDRLARIGVPHLILTGGEPTLHPDLEALVRHADGLGLVVGMNTNGRRLAQPGFAAALKEAGLNHVQVTLESHLPEVHDAMVGARAFAETVEGVREALDAGLHTITNTTLTRRNLRGALETVDFLHALGLRTFAMNGIIHAGGGRGDPDAVPAEEMAPLLAAVRDRAAALGMRFLWYTVTDYCRLSPVALGLDPKRCNAAEYSMCVEPNGDVLPCQSYYVPAGNLLRDPWEGIWESDLFRRFREREAHPREAGLPEACWDCPDLPTCGGGCPLEREAAKSVVAREGGCGGKRSSAGGGQGGG